MSMAIEDHHKDNVEEPLPDLTQPRSTAEVAQALEASGMIDDLLAQIDAGQTQIAGDGGPIPG